MWRQWMHEGAQIVDQSMLSATRTARDGRTEAHWRQWRLLLRHARRSGNGGRHGQPLALAFIAEALLLTAVLACLLGKWQVTRLSRGWFVVLALAGGLGFALPPIVGSRHANFSDGSSAVTTARRQTLPFTFRAYLDVSGRPPLAGPNGGGRLRLELAADLRHHRRLRATESTTGVN